MNDLIKDDMNDLVEDDQEDSIDCDYDFFFVKNSNGITELKEDFVIEPDYGFNGNIIGYSICLNKNKF